MSKITMRLGKFDFSQLNGKEVEIYLKGAMPVKLPNIQKDKDNDITQIDNIKLSFQIGKWACLDIFLYNVNQYNEKYSINGRAGIVLAKLDALKLEIIDGIKTGNVILDDTKLSQFYGKKIKCSIFCDSFENAQGEIINFVRLIPKDNGELGLIYLEQLEQAKTKAKLEQDAMYHLDSSLDTTREQEFNRGIDNY